MSAQRAIKAFTQIIQWASAHETANAIVVSLRKPATDAEIAKFEAKTKLKLPPSLEAIYRMHNGQSDAPNQDKSLDEMVDTGIFPSIAGGMSFQFVPIDELTKNTPTTKKDSRMPGYRLNWVPFGSNYGGDEIVLDLSDTTPEKHGRVLEFNHECGCATELAPSFEAYLEHLAAGLKAGTIRYSEDMGMANEEDQNWDDLIEAGKTEYDEESVSE